MAVKQPTRILRHSTIWVDQVHFRRFGILRGFQRITWWLPHFTINSQYYHFQDSPVIWEEDSESLEKRRPDCCQSRFGYFIDRLTAEVHLYLRRSGPIVSSWECYSRRSSWGPSPSAQGPKCLQYRGSSELPEFHFDYPLLPQAQTVVLHPRHQQIVRLRCRFSTNIVLSCGQLRCVCMICRRRFYHSPCTKLQPIYEGYNSLSWSTGCIVLFTHVTFLGFPVRFTIQFIDRWPEVVL